MIPKSEGISKISELMAAAASHVNPRTYAEIIGIVDHIIVFGAKNKPIEFVVYCPQSQKKYNCTCAYFCPLNVGDSIYAYCEVIPVTPDLFKLRVDRPPFVELRVDRDSIISCFIKVFRGKKLHRNKAIDLYESFCKNAKTQDPNTISSYISSITSKYVTTRDRSLLHPYSFGMNEDQIREFFIWWHKNQSKRRLYLFGLNNGEIKNCHLPYDEIYEALVTNPYILIPLSLEKCDEILQRQNKPVNQLDRRCGVIVRKMHALMEEKSWATIPIATMAAQYPDLVGSCLERLYSKFGINNDDQFPTLYLKYPFQVEMEVASWMTSLIKSPQIFSRCDIQFKSKTLSPDQKEAIVMALNNKLCIIQGEAGTGKTVIIDELNYNWDLRNERYVNSSFTGKAVARLREVLRRRDPSTLDKLIATFFRIPKFEHLVVDEGSMPTTELMHRFRKVFKHDYSVTIVGDVNQLQPVGWGSWMEQLCKNSDIPKATLTVNHRFAQVEAKDNGILINSKKIIASTVNFTYTPTDNFLMVDGNMETVTSLVQGFQQQGVAAADLTIITPRNEELAELNRNYQAIYNTQNHKFTIDTRGIKWMVCDRVMMLSNNYDINVFNGTEGVITAIMTDQESENGRGYVVIRFGQDEESHRFFLEPSKFEYKSRVDEDDPDADPETHGELTVKMITHSFCYHYSQILKDPSTNMLLFSFRIVEVEVMRGEVTRGVEVVAGPHGEGFLTRPE